ncbi:hypothetical protein ACHQM5_027182 [Ranunculus cassubicifolius]
MATSNSSQYTYSNGPYFPTPFHLQQSNPNPNPIPVQQYPTIQVPPTAPLTVSPTPPVIPTVYPSPLPAVGPYPLPQYQQAQQLFQRDAQTITPEAIESVKAALASSEAEKKTEYKKKAVPRKAAGQSWEDPTLAEWPENKRTGKTRGYGFVSFSNPSDLAAAIKEVNGKYVGNRPIKLRKSTWKERTDMEALQRQRNQPRKKEKLPKKSVLHK